MNHDFSPFVIVQELSGKWRFIAVDCGVSNSFEPKKELFVDLRLFFN